MSYCRFSSDNMMSDVYVYADCGGGWTTHVAGNRLIFPPIPSPPYSMVIVRGATWDIDARQMVYARKIDKLIAGLTSRLYLWLNKPHSWSLRLIPHRPIGFSHDGESFNHDTPGECADWLEHLRAIGYRVPQFAIDTLREEIEQ